MKITIIGGGIIGLFSAYYLHKEGYEVEVLEKGDFSDGCSYGNVGLLVPSHFIPLAAPGIISKGLKWMFDSSSPFYIQLRLSLDLMRWLWHFYNSCDKRHVERSVPVLLEFHMQSKTLYQQLAREINFSYEEKGMLSVCKSASAFEEEIEVAKHAERLGMKVKILDDKDLESFPTGAKLQARGGVWFAEDAHLHPGILMTELRKQLIAGGVIFRNEAAISGFEVKKGCVTGLISENGKNYPVDHVVLSGGAWSGKLMRSLGVHMPVQPAKGYSITMPKPAGAPDLPVILSEAKVVLTPMGDELRIGGTLEMSNFNENIKIRRVEAILKAVPQYFPKIRPKMPLAENIWYGFRPCSPDGLPYIGRVLKFENLTIAAGHAMLGISLGPATGRLIADLIANKKSNLQLELFNPERF